jgi:hypothetical protein
MRHGSAGHHRFRPLIPIRGLPIAIRAAAARPGKDRHGYSRCKAGSSRWLFSSWGWDGGLPASVATVQLRGCAVDRVPQVFRQGQSRPRLEGRHAHDESDRAGGVIEEAYETDPASAAAEYGSEFRADVETFVTRRSSPMRLRQRLPGSASRSPAQASPARGSSR